MWILGSKKPCRVKRQGDEMKRNDFGNQCLYYYYSTDSPQMEGDAMKRTAIYMRVSTDKQAQEGDSIPAQREALTKYVTDHADLVLAGEYLDDGVSGQKYQRDELQRLLDDVRQGKIDQICFVKLDRWFRSVRHYTATQEVLDKYGVGWTAIWEPIYDTTTPSGRLIVNQMMSIAQFEAENTSQRIRQVFRYKAAKGEVLSGNQPFGFSIENKRLVPNQDAEKVVDLFNFFRANPCYSELAKYAHIKYGLTKKQANWKRMLQETKYIGVYKGVSDYCEPIIPIALFEAVQRQMQAPVKASTRHVYIFSGIFFCAECGCAMNGTSRTDGYLVYRCQRHFCAVPACDNQKTMFEKTLEKELLSRITLQGSLEAQVMERKPKKNIKSLERKIERLKELFVNDLISLDEYKADREAIEAQITALQAPYSPKHEALDKIIGQDVQTLYKGFNSEEKRLFWRSIVKEIRMDASKQLTVEFA